MVDMPLLAPLHAIFPPGFPPALRDIAELLYLQLHDEHVAADSADRTHVLASIAMRQVERLSTELGGGNLYVHKGVSYRLTPRNRQMCAEFRGDYKTLARKYKLSEQQVRNIVDAWQCEEFKRKQCDMFSEAQPGGAAQHHGHDRKTRRKA